MKVWAVVATSSGIEGITEAIKVRLKHYMGPRRV